MTTWLDTVRHMDKRLRVLLIATALLLIEQIGQFVAVRDLNTAGKESNLALLFTFATVAIIPTALILTAAVAYVAHKTKQDHQRLLLLAAINTLIAVNLVWFMVDACSWSAVTGLTLKVCK